MAIVRLAGELDVDGVPNVAQRLNGLLHDGNEQVVLDMSRLGFADVAAVRMLRELSELADGLGIVFTVQNPCRLVVRILDLAGWQLGLAAS